jgi:hypothetical protein
VLLFIVWFIEYDSGGGAYSSICREINSGKAINIDTIQSRISVTIVQRRSNFLLLTIKNQRSTAIIATVNVDTSAVNVGVKLTNLQRNAPNIQSSSNAADSVIGIDTHNTNKSFRP